MEFSKLQVSDIEKILVLPHEFTEEAATAFVAAD